MGSGDPAAASGAPAELFCEGVFVTIICIKDGVVAADGSSWDGSVMVSMNKIKIVKSRDGAIGAACGVAGSTAAFRAWFESGDALSRRYASGRMTFDKESGFEAIWVEPTGEIWNMGFDGWPYAVAQPAASGVASQLALGAMYAGASAEQAVHICVERHDGAGGEVFIERLEANVTPENDEQVNDPSADPELHSGDFHASEDFPAPSDGSAWRERLNRMGLG